MDALLTLGSSPFNSLLAFGRNKDLYPNFEALMLSPAVGWCLWIALAGLLAFFIAHSEKWRRLWLQMGDPRSVALLRIVFGLFTLFNVNGLWEHFDYLFTSDGIFPTDVAQQVRAKGQFAGYGDGSTPGENVGFFGWAGFMVWLKGSNHSLLLLNGSQGFFWTHIIVFEAAMIAFILGIGTKYTKWIAWFAFHSITMRNTMYWEGTENVYRCFFFYLALSRSGQAYSVDNWLRCRRLRKAGRLSVRGGPGDGAGVPKSEASPKGLEAIYRAIPMWPRWLMIIQTAVVYGYAGPTKNGNVWAKGDAFYYAFNLDHFYRLPPQELSAIFGTNLFRVNSFVVHYWQMFFPVVVVGLVIRWVVAERFEPLSAMRRRISRLGLLSFAGAMLAAVIIAYPVHYKEPKDGLTIQQVQWIVGIVTPLGLAAGTWFFWRLATKPFGFSLRGHKVAVDLPFFFRWAFGRRIWLGLGLIFHLHLIIMMNIGWFNPGLASTYLAYLNGGELVSLACAFKRSIAKLRGATPEELAEIRPIPPEDPRRLVRAQPGARLGLATLLAGAAIGLSGAVMHAITRPDLWPRLTGAWGWRNQSFPVELNAQVPSVHAGWFLTAAAVMVLVVTFEGRRGRGPRLLALPFIAALPVAVGYVRIATNASMAWALLAVGVATWLACRNNELASKLDGASEESAPQYPWAYGVWGRLIAGGVVAYHLLGLTAWMLPQKDSLSTFRGQASAPFKFWLKQTQTTQSWSMFAPNPPRSNMFMRVLVHDKQGEIWDLNTDVYACLEKDASPELCDAVFPQPWIWYSRQRKMNRRIAGSEGGGGAWYQKWHARYECRTWALAHNGELPEKVEIVKVTYPVPTPEYVRDHGAYVPATQYQAKGRQKSMHTTKCATAPFGQPTLDQLTRAGIDPTGHSEQKGWVKKRCSNFNKQREKKFLEKGWNEEDALVECMDGSAEAPAQAPR